MKEDYLWDKTGEPDPEIQELERVLGTLRYQPRPLDIPAGLAPARTSTFFPRLPRLLAIAATIAIMLLGVGLWFGVQRMKTHEAAGDVARDATHDATKGESKSTTTGADRETVAVRPSPESNSKPVVPSAESKDKSIRHRVSPGSISQQLATNRRPKLSTPALTPNERAEAEAAKEQLMLALRVASSKLNFAQKKAQEINTPNLTHNQHKAG